MCFCLDNGTFPNTHKKTVTPRFVRKSHTKGWVMQTPPRIM